MMTPGSISALKDALRAKASPKAPTLPSLAAHDPAKKPDPFDSQQNPPSDDPDPGDDSDNQDSSAMDAKIVDVLQTQYPKIYARIAQMVKDEPDDVQQSDSPDPSQPDAAAMG